MTLEVVKPGPATTVQGGPVRGRAHRGFSVGGAADPRALALANGVLGNAAGALGLECVLGGPVLRARATVELCVAGAPFPVSIERAAAGAEAVALGRPLLLQPGDLLRLGICRSGLRAAVAFAGGLDAAAGSALRVGDVLRVGSRSRASTHAAAGGVDGSVDAWAALEDAVLRVVAGPQPFPAAAWAALLEGAFIVGRDSDRRGARLEGAPVEGGREILTEGANAGAVQVPPSGQPIVLGVDRCATGGYAKIANVISADQWRLGQLRPGARVRFCRVTVDEARAAFLQEHAGEERP